MRFIKQLGTGLIVVALMYGGAQPSPAIPRLSSMSVAAATAAGAGDCYNLKEEDRGFTSKMNAERSKDGKGSMKLDVELSKAAIKHTGEMVNKDLLHHTSTTSLSKRVIGWSTLGENVGVGGSVDSLHEAFMNSPAHRDNILFGKFNHVGVGTKVKGDRMWVTVIFEAQANPDSPLCG